MPGYQKVSRWNRRHLRAPRPSWPVALISSLLQRHGRLARALLVYTATLTGFVLAYTLLDSADLLSPWLEYNARASGFLVTLFGADVEVTGPFMLSESVALQVIEQCMPLAPIAIFSAAVIAYPALLSRKILGVAVGVLALSTINLVRISSLFFIGSAFPGALEIAHQLVWQSVMIILSATLWLVWMRGYAQPATA